MPRRAARPIRSVLIAAALWLAPATVADLAAQDVSDDWQDQVGFAVLNGQCERAFELLEEARRFAQPLADHFLAGLYEDGRCVARDYHEAFELYQIAADQDFFQSFPRIGLMYLEGRGAPGDREAARFWFRKTVMSIHSFPRESRLLFIRAMLSERDVPQAVLDEFEWANGLEDGVPRALYEAALRVRDGDGLPQDEDAAIRLLRLAGDRGVPEARYEAGLMLLDAAEDHRWSWGLVLIAKAGAAGLVEAQEEVGLRFAYGRGVRQSAPGATILWPKPRSISVALGGGHSPLRQPKGSWWGTLPGESLLLRAPRPSPCLTVFGGVGRRNPRNCWILGRVFSFA